MRFSFAPSAVYNSEDDLETSRSDNENMEADIQEASSISNPSSPGKRKYKGRGKTKVEYIESLKQRSDTANKSGKSLVKLVAEYQIKTGAKVYFKALYKGAQSTKLYTHGENFKVDADDTSFVDDDAFRFAPKKSGGPKKLPIGVTSSTAIMPSFPPQKCVVCKNKDVVQNLIKYESNWIQCGGSCERCAHIDCLGFPGASAEEILKLPTYYCPKHVQIGRKEKKVKFAFAEEPEPTTSGRKQKKVKKEYNSSDSDSE